MYKEGLALNNLPCLICYKTKPNQIIVAKVEKTIYLKKGFVSCA